LGFKVEGVTVSFREMVLHRTSTSTLRESDLSSDIDIKTRFPKVDSREKKQLWTYNKNKTRQKWRVIKKNQF
jgi:hypothetical protein